jgi:hypothetical protein
MGRSWGLFFGCVYSSEQWSVGVFFQKETRFENFLDLPLILCLQFSLPVVILVAVDAYEDPTPHYDDQHHQADGHKGETEDGVH